MAAVLGREIGHAGDHRGADTGTAIAARALSAGLGIRPAAQRSGFEPDVGDVRRRHRGGTVQRQRGHQAQGRQTAGGQPLGHAAGAATCGHPEFRGHNPLTHGLAPYHLEYSVHSLVP